MIVRFDFLEHADEPLGADDWGVGSLLVGYGSLGELLRHSQTAVIHRRNFDPHEPHYVDHPCPAFSSTLFVTWDILKDRYVDSLHRAISSFLLQNFMLFFLVPLAMLVDLTARCTVISRQAQPATIADSKTRHFRKSK